MKIAKGGWKILALFGLTVLLNAHAITEGWYR